MYEDVGDDEKSHHLPLKMTSEAAYSTEQSCVSPMIATGIGSYL